MVLFMNRNHCVEILCLLGKFNKNNVTLQYSLVAEAQNEHLKSCSVLSQAFAFSFDVALS